MSDNRKDSFTKMIQLENQLRFHQQQTKKLTDDATDIKDVMRKFREKSVDVS